MVTYDTNHNHIGKEGVLMLIAFLSLALTLFSLVLHISGLLRLTIPLLYALLVPTLFRDWYYAHQAMAEGIWYAMLVTVALSWVVTIVKRVKGD